VIGGTDVAIPTVTRPPRIFAAFLALLVAADAHAQSAATEQLTLSFNTTTTGRCYEPRNCTVVWVETSDGQFIKTLSRWASGYKDELVTWWAASGQDLDGMTEASRRTHDDRLTAVWDMTDSNGDVAPDGSYTIRFEMTECNNGNYENLYSIDFDKDGNGLVNSTGGGGFENVDLDYTGRGPLDPGVIELDQASYSVGEKDGAATLAVSRTQGADGPVEVSFITGDGTAGAGSDYDETSGTITFMDGETGVREIVVPITDDGDVEGAESFLVTLTDVTGATFGAIHNAEVLIADDDVAPGQDPPVNPPVVDPPVDATDPGGEASQGLVLRGYTACSSASRTGWAALGLMLLLRRRRR